MSTTVNNNLSNLGVENDIRKVIADILPATKIKDKTVSVGSALDAAGFDNCTSFCAQRTQNFSKETNEKMYNDLKSLGPEVFARSVTVMLNVLIEAFNEAYKAHAQCTQMHTELAEMMTENAAEDIRHEGSAELIGGVIGSGFNVGLSAAGAYKQTQAVNLKFQSSLPANAGGAAGLENLSGRAATCSMLLRSGGESSHHLAGGISGVEKSGEAAKEKKDEQDAHVGNVLTDTAKQEGDNDKQVRENMLNIIQQIIDSQAQAANTAAKAC